MNYMKHVSGGLMGLMAIIGTSFLFGFLAGKATERKHVHVARSSVIETNESFRQLERKYRELLMRGVKLPERSPIEEGMKADEWEMTRKNQFR